MNEAEITRIQELKSGRVYIITLGNATKTDYDEMSHELRRIRLDNTFIVVRGDITIDELKDYLKRKNIKEKKRWWKR